MKLKMLIVCIVSLLLIFCAWFIYKTNLSDDPERITKSYFDNLLSMRFEYANYYLFPSDNYNTSVKMHEKQKLFTKHYFEKTKYKIISVNKENNAYIVFVETATPDVSKYGTQISKKLNNFQFGIDEKTVSILDKKKNLGKKYMLDYIYKDKKMDIANAYEDYFYNILISAIKNTNDFKYKRYELTLKKINGKMKILYNKNLLTTEIADINIMYSKPQIK